MLEINKMNIESVAQNALNNNNISIETEPINRNEYINIFHFINGDTSDTIFNVIGATQNFINGIDKNKYIINEIKKNENYSNRFDFTYSNK